MRNKYVIDVLLPQAYQGGVENVVNMLAVYLKSCGYVVRIIQFVGSGKWCDASIPVTIFEPQGKYFSVEEAAERYRTLLEEQGMPDIVLASVWPVMCTIAKNAIEKVNEQKTQRQKQKAKIVSWLHHGAVQFVESSGWGGFVELKNADFHFTMNQFLYDQFCDNVPEKVVVRVTNPVRTVEQSVSSEKKERKSTFLQVVYVGRLTEQKRIDVLIKAISKTSGKCELHMIGCGEKEYEEYIHRLIVELDCEKQIHFYPWRQNPWELASMMDICVMTSEMEGFPLVAIEALSNGLPLFSTPAEGIEEIVNDGINGYLFPFEDDATLAKLLSAYADGYLPKMSPENCINSVERYRMKYVLPDLERKIHAIIVHEEELRNIHFVPDFLYYGHKISIVVTDAIDELKEEWVDSILFHNHLMEKGITFEICFLVTNQAKEIERLIEIEKKYRDQICIIMSDHKCSQEEVKELLLTYSAGNYIYIASLKDKINLQKMEEMYEEIVLLHKNKVSYVRKYVGKELLSTETMYSRRGLQLELI